MEYEKGIPGCKVQNSVCEVCDCKLNYSDFLDPYSKKYNYSVCRSQKCRRVMEQKEKMAPLMFKAHLEFNKKIICQHRERNEQKQKRIETITKKEIKEKNKIKKIFLKENPDCKESDVYTLVIPSGSTEVKQLESDRVEKYKDHLLNVVSEARAFSSVSSMERDEHSDAHQKRCKTDAMLTQDLNLKNISDELCTMCKGGCCASGREHAYLSAFSMRKLMDESPELSNDDVINLYLSKVYQGAETVKNSCINQTTTGCVLPRELRSDICNGYYCDSLKKYQEANEAVVDNHRVLVIQRAYNYWNRFDQDVNSDIVDVAVVSLDENKKVDWLK